VNECASRIQWQATETVDDRLLIDPKGGWYRFSRKLDDCNARRLVFLARDPISKRITCNYNIRPRMQTVFAVRNISHH